MNFRKILVPVTLSAKSHAALPIALKLAQDCGASLVLLYAVQLNIAGEERGIPRTRLLDELCRDAETQLRQLVKNLPVEVPVEVVACAGRPVETIVEKANSLSADVIVMCTHGYRGWLRWLHRNTARQVLRRAPCPVWLISPAQHGGVSLVIVDHTTVNQCEEHHENTRSLQPVLRV